MARYYAGFGDAHKISRQVLRSGFQIKPEAFTGFLVKSNMNEFISGLKRMGILDQDKSEVPDKILVQQYLVDFSRRVEYPVVVTAGEDGDRSVSSTVC